MYSLIVRLLLSLIDPGRVHRMLLNWLKIYRYLPSVRVCVRGHYQVDEPFSHGSPQFKNQTGLSTGFDKNVETSDELVGPGFGLLGVGTIVPDYQPGNPPPHIFRLVENESLISRTGFNSCGVDVAPEHIRKYRRHSYGFGVSINKNLLSAGGQITKDLELTFTRLYESMDYSTLNWGSIDKGSFVKALENLTTLRQVMNKRCSIFVKFPAGINEKALGLVIPFVYKYSIEDFIATGLMMDCSELHHTKIKQLEKISNGGTSGRGIGKEPQKVVRYLPGHTGRHFLTIEAGGMMAAGDAADMAFRGVGIIQTYSAFIYSGLPVVHKTGKRLKH